MSVVSCIGELWPSLNLMAGFHLSDISDFSGHGYDLTNNNGVTFLPGKFINGAYFGDANTNKCLSRAGSIGIGNADPCTMVAWFKPTVQPPLNTRFVFDAISTANNGKWHAFEYENADGSYFSIIETYTDNYHQIIFPGQLVLNSWNCFILGYNGTTNLTGLLNGKLGSTSVVDSTVGTLTQGIFIGSTTGGNFPTSGMVDEVAYLKDLWSEARMRRWWGWCTGKL